MNGPILRGQIDTFLEEAKAAIKNLIGLKIFPEYGSPLQSGQYLKLRIALAELLNADVARHSPGAAFVRYTRTFEYANFDCVAGHTIVLTQEGFVPLKEVRADHLVFDGHDFVSHQGLLNKGVRDVVTVHGVTATPDHRFNIDGEWKALESLKALSFDQISYKLLDSKKSFPEVEAKNESRQAVYDLLNCGERNQFAVFLSANKYLIAHNCIEYGIEELVPYVQADETGRYGLDQQSKAAELAMRRMLLAHELRVQSQVFNSSNFTVLQPSVNYTLANGGQATNGVNVVNDILTARRQLEIQGIDPFSLTLIIASPLWDYVKQSSILQNYLRGNRPTDSDKLMQPQDFAALFDLKDVLVGRASYNTSGKNVVPAVLAYIWPNTYWALVEIVGGDFSAGGVGRTIFWEKYGNLFTSEEYPEYQRDSAVVRVKGNMIETVVNLTAGVLTVTNANF